jgi:hypothetical protein
VVRTTAVELMVLGPVGELDVDLAEMNVRRTVECTLLETTVRDQSALYGLLQRLSALGLELLELRTARPGGPSDVEIVVRGPVGHLARTMLLDVGRTVSATLASGRVEDVDLARLLAAAWARSSPAAGSDATSHASRPDAPGAAPPEPGLVHYVVLELPGRTLDGEVLSLLAGLVDDGVVRVLDVACVEKGARGEVRGIGLRDLDVTGEVDVSSFGGASSRLLDDEELREAGAALEPGSAAVLVVYENAWAAPFAAAVRRGGGALVAGGRIPTQAVVAAPGGAEEGERR